MSLTRVGGDLLKQPLNIGTGVTITPDGNASFSGIVTAANLVGSDGRPIASGAGLGTAVVAGSYARGGGGRCPIFPDQRLQSYSWSLHGPSQGTSYPKEQPLRLQSVCSSGCILASCCFLSRVRCAKL